MSWRRPPSFLLLAVCTICTLQEAVFAARDAWLTNCLHSFNLVADALLPLYLAMVGHYGKPRPDARVWIQHDGLQSRRTTLGADDLQAELVVAERTSSPLSLLRLFTSAPIGNRADWDDHARERGTTCFRNLHVGLDVRNTFLHAGASATHPQHSVVDVRTDTAVEMADAQRGFITFLLSGMSLGPQRTLPRLGNPASAAALVERVVINVVDASGSKAGVHGFTNVDDVVRAFDTTTRLAQTATVQPVSLARLGVRKLAELMGSTSVLVTPADEMATAAMFLPRGAVMVLVPEPGLFGWKWMHANLALLSGVHVVALRRPSDCDDTEGFGGVQDHTQVEPTSTECSIDADVLNEAVQAALDLREAGTLDGVGSSFVTVPDVCEDEYSDAEDDQPWFCQPTAQAATAI